MRSSRNTKGGKVPAPLTANIHPGGGYIDISAYEASGGYRGLRKAVDMPSLEVQEAVKKAGLRGRGGAGFPTGQKWSFVPLEDGERHYFVVNADEKEPGTMKDRFLVEGDPHQLIEGTIIAAHAVKADTAFIFLRREYGKCAQALTRAIQEARDAGYLGKNILDSPFSLEIRLHRSAGRYMCGEETGLLNAIEGRRAAPRNKPPFPQASGLWGKPTLVNNTETVCNLPHILREGADWYRRLAPESSDTGTKIYGVSGKVKHPGLWELPMGTTIEEILLGRAGGMRDGLSLKGLLPGGGSTDFLGPDNLGVKMDFDSVAKAGSRLGTGTIIALDSESCPVGMVLNLLRFFARESCGWCTPCREGLPWIVRTLEALEQGKGEKEDLKVLDTHARLLSPGRTFCPLAPGAMEPLGSALRLFREDFEAHVKGKRCPWR
jgi:NADH-quinone oxidoreductase subunit F